MSYYAEHLRLPKEDLNNLIVAYGGYAEVLQKRENNEELYPWIASNLLYSASLQLIVSPELSKPMFREAAFFFRKLQMPFWKICAICADDQELIFSDHNDIKTHNSNLQSQEELFYAILLNYDREMFRTTKSFSGKTEIESQSFLLKGKIGKIGIPFKFISELINESREWNEHTTPDSIGKFSELLNRIYELVEVNQSDDFHWRSLNGSILPIEPLGLALVIIFVRRWLKKSDFLVLKSLYNFNSNQLMLLDIANELIAGQGESQSQLMF